MSFLCWSGLGFFFPLLFYFHFKSFLKTSYIVCILVGTSVFTENSALSFAKMGSLQLKSDLAIMSSVLVEGAWVYRASVVLNKEGTETAALIGSQVPVFLMLGILHVSSRFFAYTSSSEKSKMKKCTIQNKSRNHFSSFLMLAVFLHHRKLYSWKSQGSWEMLETSKQALLVPFSDESFVTLIQQLFISK